MKTFRRGTWARTLVFFVCATFVWMAVGLDSAYAWDWTRSGKCKGPETDDPWDDDNLGNGCGNGANCPGGVCKQYGSSAYTPTYVRVQPVITATGNVALRGAYAIGFIDLGGGPLFTPWYNSQQIGAAFNMGPKWRSSYHMRLTFPSGTLVTFEDADGTPWSFTKNADGTYTPEAGYRAKLTKIAGWGVYALTLTNGRMFWFNLSGKLLWVFPRDLMGACAVTYDGGGRLSAIEVYIRNSQGGYDPTGRKLTVAYDPNSRIQSVTSPGSRQIGLAYDAAGHLTTITDPAGALTTYGYDSSDRIVSVIVNSHIWFYTYNANNYISSVTDPLNHTTTYAYSTGANGRIATCAVTDPLNHTWFYSFDSDGRLTGITDPLLHSHAFTYDSAWNRTSMTNERGQTWNYGYNGWGDRTSVTDPQSHVTKYDYGYISVDDHLLKKITDPLNHVTTLTYNSGGHLLTVTDPNNNITTCTYNSNGMLASVTDARNHTTTYGYTSNYSPAFVTSITDPLLHTTSFTYDAIGNCTSVTDARGNTTYYTYDSDRRLTQITFPSDPAKTRLFAYNCCNLTSMTDENGKTTTYHYDNAERLSYVTDAENHDTHYAYDNAGNLTSVTDANSHTTTYTYSLVSQELFLSCC
jgi:YD repeat-containing protein